MVNCGPADTPIEMNRKLREDEKKVPANKCRYQRIVGRLIHLSHMRPI